MAGLAINEVKWLSVLQSHARVPDSAQVCIDYRSHNEIVSAFQVKSNQGNRKQACENRCHTAHLAVAVDLQRSFNKAGHHCAVQASFCFRNSCLCKRSPGRNWVKEETARFASWCRFGKTVTAPQILIALPRLLGYVVSASRDSQDSSIPGTSIE